MESLTTTQRLLILAALYLLLSGGKIIPGGSVASVTFVHDREDPVPSGVRVALDKLNHRTPPILATAYELEDVTPAQYVIAVEYAKKVGLPAVVSTSKTAGIRAIPNPKTEEDVYRCLP